MGLKLRWFRRRITFDGIPPAPERSIRRKEATSGTVIGVYRHSSHFEDYIEPVRSSYWEPPPQAIARATIRTSNPSSTSTNHSPSSSAASDGRLPLTMKAPVSAPLALPVPTTISSVSRLANVVVGSPVIDRKPDKIESATERVGGARLSNGMHLETPPEPTYTPPPLPPARKGLGKAKSLASLAPAAPSRSEAFDRMPPSDESEDSDIYGYVTSADSQLRSTQSVEVLTSISVSQGSASSPTASPIAAPIPRTRSTTSLTQLSHSTSPSLSSLSSSTSTVLEGERPSPRTNKVLAASNESPSESEEPFQTIFERVKLRSNQESPPPVLKEDSPPATPTPPPPQRKPVLVVSPTPSAHPTPPQPKSILKKRAPAPPPVEATSEIAFQMPTAPPRAIRTLDASSSDSPTPKSPKTPEVPDSQKRVTATPQDVDDDDDDDDDFNWDFVQRHRSSINQTVAAQTQIDPEVLRNAPAALRQPTPASVPANRSPVEPVAQPRTLRGMRNQRARPQEMRDWSAEPRTGTVEQETHQARASDSNTSETSA